MKLVLLLLSFSCTIFGWPDEYKFPDCKYDKILYVVSRACAKRSTLNHRLRSDDSRTLLGKSRKPFDADEEEAMGMTFMAAIQQELENENTSTNQEDQDENAGNLKIQNEPIGEWPVVWTAHRRVRQEEMINNVIKACCSGEPCSPHSLAGLSQLCPV